MSSKRRLRRRSCERKTRHETYPAAMGALKALLRTKGDGGWPMRAYRCSFCKGFHIGYVPASKLQGWRR